jgi:hypothetical protein
MTIKQAKARGRRLAAKPRPKYTKAAFAWMDLRDQKDEQKTQYKEWRHLKYQRRQQSQRQRLQRARARDIEQRRLRAENRQKARLVREGQLLAEEVWGRQVAQQPRLYQFFGVALTSSPHDEPETVDLTGVVDEESMTVALAASAAVAATSRNLLVTPPPRADHAASVVPPTPARTMSLSPEPTVELDMDVLFPGPSGQRSPSARRVSDAYQLPVGPVQGAEDRAWPISPCGSNCDIPTSDSLPSLEEILGSWRPTTVVEPQVEQAAQALLQLGSSEQPTSLST